LTRTVLVTGASSGIGEATALHLRSRGWRVLAGVRREEDAERLGAAGLEPLTLDVTDAAQIAAAADAVGDDPLHGLVNNAGIALAIPLEYVPLDQLRRQLEINVIGQVAMTQAVLPALRRAPGRIVNMSSIAGRSALPFLGPYAASKHALEALSDALRLELRPWGIDVIVIEPGTIATPIWTRSAAVADDLFARLPPEAGARYGARIASFRKLAGERGARGAPVATVAAAVERALTAENPRPRVVVGSDAIIRGVLEHLPVRLRDRLLERVLFRRG
jgi:NAD(P)-dependent dehydrogenase (short-subunit alcohol dehydrogenase family)